MPNKANFLKSQMFITSIKTMNYSEKLKLDTWSKRTQTKPILPAMAGKIAPLFRMPFILMGPVPLLRMLFILMGPNSTCQRRATNDERLTSQRYRHLLSAQVFDPELSRRHPYKSLECSRKIALIIIADLKTNFRAVLRRRQQ